MGKAYDNLSRNQHHTAGSNDIWEEPVPKKAVMAMM